MFAGDGRSRNALLWVAGAYAVHHGRYLVAHCSHAQEELGGGAHAHLSLIAPLVGCLCAMAVIRLARRVAAHRAPTPMSRMRLWLSASLILASSYGFAEFFEGRVDAAHRAGLSNALGHGGFSVLAIAVVVAAVLALLYKVSAFVVRRIAKALRRRRRPQRTYTAPPTRHSTLVRRPAFVCLSLYAGRGPPLLAA